MSATLLTARESTFEIKAEGAPILDTEFDEVVVKIRKEGETSFTTKTLEESDWQEIGEGFYAIRWSSEDMDTLGDFRFLIQGEEGFAMDPVTGSFDVVPAPIMVAPETNVCIVTGNIVEINGLASRQETITFRPQRVPATTGASLINSSSIKTTTDAFGNFAVALIQGAKVIVEVERLAIRYLIEIPESPSASLLSLLPEIA